MPYYRNRYIQPRKNEAQTCRDCVAIRQVQRGMDQQPFVDYNGRKVCTHCAFKAEVSRFFGKCNCQYCIRWLC